jgi:hypothetical protein
VTYDPRTSSSPRQKAAVRITYGPYVLNASKVTFNHEDQACSTANGSVELREPNGNVLTGRDGGTARPKFKQVFATSRDGVADQQRHACTAQLCATDDSGRHFDLSREASATRPASNCSTKSGHPSVGTGL